MYIYVVKQKYIHYFFFRLVSKLTFILHCCEILKMDISRVKNKLNKRLREVKISSFFILKTYQNFKQNRRKSYRE